MTRLARYVRTSPSASNPLTAPNSAPLRICPRGASWWNNAGTARSMMSARATDTAMPRVRGENRVITSGSSTVGP